MVAGGWLALLTLVAVLLGCWATPYNAKVKAPALVRPRTAEQGGEPSLSSPPAAFEIQAWVPNDRINAIQLDQRVQLRVNSCPYSAYGVLEGRVSHIASDTPAGAALIQPVGSNGGEYANAYQVTIQPEDPALAVAGQKSCELRAGMEGRADIWVGQARLLSFLMQKVRL